MIQLVASAPAIKQIRENPRSWLDAVRATADSSPEWYLEGCWFSESGNSIVAILHTTDNDDADVIRRAFAQTGQNVDVRVDSLLTLRELDDRDSAVGEVPNNRIGLDPVDLGSDLSFPASDPPAWQDRSSRAMLDN